MRSHPNAQQIPNHQTSCSYIYNPYLYLVLRPVSHTISYPVRYQKRSIQGGYRSSGVFDYGPREVEVYVVYRIYGVVVRCLVSQWHHSRSIYICELGMRTSRSRIYFHWTQTILRKHQLINQQIPPAKFAHTQSLEFNHFNCARAQTL